MTFTLCPLRKYRSFTLKLCYPPNEGAGSRSTCTVSLRETRRLIIEIKRTESFHRHHSSLLLKITTTRFDSVKPSGKLNVKHFMTDTS